MCQAGLGVNVERDHGPALNICLDLELDHAEQFGQSGSFEPHKYICRFFKCPIPWQFCQFAWKSSPGAREDLFIVHLFLDISNSPIHAPWIILPYMYFKIQNRLVLCDKMSVFQQASLLCSAEALYTPQVSLIAPFGLWGSTLKNWAASPPPYTILSSSHKLTPRK